MLFVFMVAGLTLGSVYGSLSKVSDSELSGFLTTFRQTLLEKIAVETNSTVKASEALEAEMKSVCKPKIETAVAKCKLCAKTECQSSPSFTDILKFANPLQYLKGPLDSIASKINDAKDLLGIKIAPFVNSMKNLGAAIPDTIKDVFAKIKVGLEAVYKALHLEKIGNIATNIGKLIADDLNTIGNSIKDFFTGRRRRRSAIDPKVRKCMQKCDDCIPLLAETEAGIVAAVCGEAIVKRNATLMAQMLKIQNVYNHVVDRFNDVVSELQMDVTDLTNMRLNNVQIKWFVEGAYKVHKAVQPVPLLDMSTTLALEFWDKYPLILPE